MVKIYPRVDLFFCPDAHKPLRILLLCKAGILKVNEKDFFHPDDMQFISPGFNGTG